MEARKYAPYMNAVTFRALHFVIITCRHAPQPGRIIAALSRLRPVKTVTLHTIATAPSQRLKLSPEYDHEELQLHGSGFLIS